MIERIPVLPPNDLLPSNGYFAFYDPVTDTTYRIKASAFLSGLVSPDDAWSPATSYSIGDIATLSGSVWISDANSNLDNPPGPGSSFWHLDPIPPAPNDFPIDSVSTTGSTITLDMLGAVKKRFSCSGNITTPKTWQINNATNAAFGIFMFQSNLGVAHTFPSDWILSDARWNDSTNIWTPNDSGKYRAEFTFDGTNYWVDISQGVYL